MTEPVSWWPIFLLVWTIATAITLIDGVDSPVGSAIVLGFLLFCPGMMIVRWLHLRNMLAELVLALAMSLGLCTVTGGVMIYLAWWKPDTGAVFLIVVTLVGTLWPVPGAKGRGYTASQFSRESRTLRASE